MAQQTHLFAHCSDGVCVAEDSNVAFFAPKTLKKFRVQGFSGSRICGLHIQPTPKGNVLHVVDAHLNWYIVSLKKVVVEHSTRLLFPAADPGSKSMHGVISCEMAHFYEMDDQLYGVLLTQDGLFEVLLAGGAVPETPVASNVRKLLPRELCANGDVLLAVGQRSGLVVVGQRGSRTLVYSTHGDRRASPSPTTGGVYKERSLSVDPHSVACSPTGERVAVGGARGELAVFPSIRDAHYFSDHWHHTPLRALAFSTDGASLVTGAQEEVLLVWNMASYDHRKVRVPALGPIRCIVPSSTVGSTLLVASAASTLSTVDLLEMKLEHSVEGVEWTADHACVGFFFSQWMGQTVAVLTGLPNALRLVDPLTQQSVYSLHVSSQMEALPCPPRRGIQFAAVLREGKTIVTYEVFAGTVLPPQLCFWSYDGVQRQHLLAQTIYSPHDCEVVAMKPDIAHQRLFTMSTDTIKCWVEALEDATSAIATGPHRSWRNQSTTPTPSHAVQSMILSSDGSLCFAADDEVHAYDIRSCAPGVSWRRVAVFTQSATRAPLRDLMLLEEKKRLCARSDSEVFAWPLTAPQGSSPTVYCASGSSHLSAMAASDKDRLLAAFNDGALAELVVRDTAVEEVHRRPAATSHPIRFLEQLPMRETHFGVMDDVSGFRLLVVDWSEAPEAPVPQAEFPNGLVPDNRAAPPPQFSHFFRSATVESGAGPEAEGEAPWSQTASAGGANRWLVDILQDAPYTAPPMSTVLSQYLDKRQLGVSWMSGSHGFRKKNIYNKFIHCAILVTYFRVDDSFQWISIVCHCIAGWLLYSLLRFFSCSCGFSFSIHLGFPHSQALHSSQPQPMLRDNSLGLPTGQRQIPHLHHSPASSSPAPMALPLKFKRNPEQTAHGVLTYVLSQELGRANVAKAGDTAWCPPPGQIAAEQASLRPAARISMRYTLRGALSARRQRPVGLREQLSEDSMRYRQSLTICSWERDWTGGVTGSHGPSVRRRLVRLLESGLRGQQWSGVDQRGASTPPPADASSTVKLDLFGGPAADVSLDAFLESDDD
eukprot:gene8384-5872_t